MLTRGGHFNSTLFSVIPGGECVLLEDNTMPSEDELDDSSCSPGGR